MLFSELLLFSAIYVTYSSRSMFAQCQLRSYSSDILSKYIHCLLTLGIIFLFGKWFIKVHWSLLNFLESLLLFICKYLLFIVFTICVYFWSGYLSLDLISSPIENQPLFTSQTKPISVKISKQYIASAKCAQQLHYHWF